MSLYVQFTRIVFLSLIVGLSQPTTVYASASLTWNIQEAFFNDGTSLTGWFTIDVINNTVTNYDIQTQTGSIFTAFHYLNVPGNSTYFGSDVWGSNPNSYLFNSEVPSEPWGDPMIQISSLSSFLIAGTNTLGTNPTNDPLNYLSNVTTEFNNDNTNNRSLVSGYAKTSTVPIPASVALFVSGLLSFFISRRKLN